MDFSVVVIVITIYFLRAMLKHDFSKGLPWAVSLMIAMPDSLRVELPGALPELTIHRLILLVIFASWVGLDRPTMSWRHLPLIKFLLFLSFLQFVSMIFSVNFTGSLKNFLSFNVETIVYYIILSTSLFNKEDAFNILRYICWGLGVVALLAIVEQYTGIHFTKVSHSSHYMIDVTSTYPHRILLGYAMVIGLPIQIFLANKVSGRKIWIFDWSISLFLIAACYFSESRGPWLGIIIASTLMFFMGSHLSRKKIFIVASLGFLLLIIRPGVYQTIANMYYATIEKDTLKAYSAQYRWKLWGVAWSEINKSFPRIFIGYGGLSTEKMDLGYYFEEGTGGDASGLGYTSWDNNFAQNLIEFGLFGFILEIILYCKILIILTKMWVQSKDEENEFYASIITSVVIYLYAMATVYIFSPQLRFLFWALLAFGCNFSRLQGRSVQARENGNVYANNTLVMTDKVKARSLVAIVHKNKRKMSNGCDSALPTAEDFGPAQIRFCARGPLRWNAGSVQQPSFLSSRAPLWSKLRRQRFC